jgi:plastocyanin
MYRARRRLLVAAMVLGVSAVSPAVAAADGPKVEPMKLRDACNKASFDATFGPGLCQRNAGSVSGAEFLSKLNPKDFGHGAWWINASGGRVGTTTIKLGDTLRAVNEGGENHTFTEVEKYTSARGFTGGCIGGLSTPLGLTPFPGDCGRAIAETIVTPGASSNRTGLSVGTHHFECILHPWMRQTVEVRRS